MNDLLRLLVPVPPELAGETWNVVFRLTPPAWSVVLGTITIGAFAWWSYAGLRGGRLARSTLALLRGASLALLVFLALGPSIEWPRERVDRDVVHVLLDRSASLQVRDDRAADGTACSRDETLRRSTTDPVWDRLGIGHDVAWHTFTGRLSDLTDRSMIPMAEGERSLLAASIDQLLARAGSRAVAAIVLVTDGRSQDGPDDAQLQRLRALSAPVITVTLGDPEGSVDRGVIEVTHPQRAFPRDRVPVAVTLRGPANQPLRVGLRDRSSGALLDERTVQVGGGRQAEATLLGQRETAGSADWEVVVLPEASDADPSNDRRGVPVEFIDRPLRVLFVDGWPRWEFRYLRNLLLREAGVESSVMLLSADRDFAQEGTSPIARLPATREEFAAFDVVILGDVPGGFLDDARQRAIRELVSRRGTGLLWIGGPRATPSSWHGLPLEDLLPFREAQEVSRWDEPVTMQPTDEALRMGLLRLGDDGSDWPAELAPGGAEWARLEWAQRIEPRELKPTVEVWARATPTSGSAAARGALPIVLSMRFGAGSVAYVGTDETWRWRHGRGETLPERFWVQLIRHLARQGLRDPSGSPSIEADPGDAVVDQPVRVVLDGVGDAKLEQVVVEAVREGDAQTIEITLRPEGSGRFAAAWPAPQPGAWSIRTPSGSPVTASAGRLVVRSEQPELVDTSPDRALLERLASATGGALLRPESLGRLEQLVPSRSTVVRQPVQRPLWDRWPLYALLASLLVAEWIGRRMLRLA